MCRYMIYVGPMNYRSSEIDEVFVAHALPAHARTLDNKDPISHCSKKFLISLIKA